MRLIVVLLVFSFINFSFGQLGYVTFDELTFDKIVKKFRTVLVKFDELFPYGHIHDSFIKVATDINNKTLVGWDNPDFLIGVVSVNDLDTVMKVNFELGKKYGHAEQKDGPVIKLFIDGDLENPINFEFAKEKVTAGLLYSFIKTHSKVPVVVPGCIKELDELAIKFVKEKNNRKKILENADEFIKKIEDEEKQKVAKVYTALMKGLIEKGEDFVQLQRERMTKLLTDKLSVKKTKELNEKLNILSSFNVATKTTKEEL